MTAPFVYARIMGHARTRRPATRPPISTAGRSGRGAWAAGDAPDGLETVAPPAERRARDVFLYVISGAKARNPAAAMALIERLR